MARKGVKRRDYERLDDATISRVVSLLEQTQPITKKAACEMLNISYNTSRLNKIIQEYKDKLEFREKRFKQNKGKPFSSFDIEELVSDYLNGDSVSSIADSLYRSVHTIKKKIEELGLPERTKSPSYQNPDIIPDEAVAENFEKAELVWAARYNAVCEIRSMSMGDNGPIYLIFVFGKHNEFAYQPWWELGKLEILKKYNIPVEKFIKYEKPQFAYRIN